MTFAHVGGLPVEELLALAPVFAAYFSPVISRAAPAALKSQYSRLWEIADRCTRPAPRS